MPWQYVGGTSGAGTSTGYTISLSGTLTGGIASSPATGDLVVVFSGFGNTASSAPNVSGNVSGAYTPATAAQHVNDTWDTEFRSFYRVMGGTPDATLTVTRVTNAAYGGATTVHVWRGVDTASPFIGAGTNASGGNAGIVNPPSYNPGVTDALIIAGGSGTLSTTGTAYGTLSGMSNTVSLKRDGTTSDCYTVMASYAYAGVAYDPPAATGGSGSGTSSSWAGVTIAFRMYVPPTQNLTQATRFDNGQTFHAPTVTVGSVGLTQNSRFDETQAFYSPTVDQSGGGQSLTQNTRFDDAQAFYQPTVTQGGAPQGLTATLYTNDPTWYAPTVTKTYAITATRYDNGQTFHAATVTSVKALTATRYDSEQTFYAPTVSQGSVTLLPTLYENAQAFYGPIVGTGNAVLLPTRVDNDQTFYAASISTGAVSLTPSRYDNSNAFYAPSVSSGGGQDITFVSHVETGWVEDGWVGWPYFNVNQFFAAEVSKPTGGPARRPKRVYIERDGQVLVFNKPTDAAAYIAAEKAEKQAAFSEKVAVQKPKQRAATAKKVEPVAVFRVSALEILAQVFQVPDYGTLIEQYEAKALIAMQNQMDEDDIELLLLAA